MKKIMALAAVGAALVFTPAMAGDTKSDPDAKVYIISPADGAVVTGPVRVVFGLRNMGVAPAGVEKKNTGHHHLLIDTEAPNGRDLDYPLPKDANNRHYGGGETETLLELEPGEHTLQLILADHNHIPHDKPVISEVITIKVLAEGEDADGGDNDGDKDGDDDGDKGGDDGAKRGGGLLGIFSNEKDGAQQ